MIRKNGIENDLQQKVEALTDEAGFEELLQFAGHICLDAPLERPHTASVLSPEAVIVKRFGLRGLRAALEIELGAEFDNKEVAQEEEDEEDEEEKEKKEKAKELSMRAESPVRFPASFSGSFSYENAATIEAFGAVLIREAYAVLGEDTDEHVERFVRAATDEEQIQELTWLDARIREIASNDHEIIDQSVEGYNYHPARLSPKLMGQYPNISIPPTCLGVSLLASSFLERAGAEYLHAGVMTTCRENELLTTAGLFKHLMDVAEEKFEALTPIEVRKALMNKSQKAVEQAFEDNGYHVALFTRLKSGGWYQFDPNFTSSSTLFSDVQNAKLDTYYERFGEMKEIAPGLELAANMNTPGSLDLLLAFLNETTSDQLPSALEVYELLDTIVDAESISDTILKEIVEPFFTAEAGEVGSHFLGLLNHTVEKDGKEIRPLEHFFTAMYEKYIRGERTDREFLESWRDEGQKIETVFAARFLPFLMMAAWATDLIDSGDQDVPQHQAVELGLPHHRVGAAVLSDFASHYDFGISPNFWLSTWNSLVPITETLDLDAGTRVQQIRRQNSLAHTEVRQLTYLKSKGIIISSLSPTESGE
jgi:hypothetical protein